MSEWIPCSERLPAEETDVHVCGIRHGYRRFQTVAGIFNGEWMSEETQELTKGDITHWMPLKDWPHEYTAQCAPEAE